MEWFTSRWETVKYVLGDSRRFYVAHLKLWGSLFVTILGVYGMISVSPYLTVFPIVGLGILLWMFFSHAHKKRLEEMPKIRLSINEHCVVHDWVSDNPNAGYSDGIEWRHINIKVDNIGDGKAIECLPFMLDLKLIDKDRDRVHENYFPPPIQLEWSQVPKEEARKPLTLFNGVSRYFCVMRSDSRFNKLHLPTIDP